VQTKDELVKRLRDLDPMLRELGVNKLGIFGSFVRGNPHDSSDVDLLVEFSPDKKNLSNFLDLNFLLENELQRKIEIVTRKSLSPYIGPRILKEVEYVSFPD